MRPSCGSRAKSVGFNEFHTREFAFATNPLLMCLQKRGYSPRKVSAYCTAFWVVVVIMKDRLFDWPTVWRHIALGGIPFLVFVLFYEKLFGEWSLGAAIMILAAILPFVAIGWLGYQHWKHRKGRSHGG
jgi:hypothetical protein